MLEDAAGLLARRKRIAVSALFSRFGDGQRCTNEADYSLPELGLPLYGFELAGEDHRIRPRQRPLTHLVAAGTARH